MFVLADIGAGDVFRVFLSTLPAITGWMLLFCTLGLLVGLALLMGSLRWMLPWSRLHELRQQRHGWVWMCTQWTWVLTWGLCLPLLALSAGGLTGSAFGARTLILREHVGQMVGERVLSPLGLALAQQLAQHYPQFGDLSKQELPTRRLRQAFEQVTPAILDQALSRVPILSLKDPKMPPFELAGRKFARKAIHFAANSFFKEKTRFIDRLLKELELRDAARSGTSSLKDVIACASHLYFTPAFAQWTFWWVLAHATALVPFILAIWLLPWGAFELMWWWRQRRIRKAMTLAPAKTA